MFAEPRAMSSRLEETEMVVVVPSDFAATTLSKNPRTEMRKAVLRAS